ncbi:MAG: dihydrolipoyl dehydrogenase [Candidatus Omnitrophota bacterium]
MYDLAVIGAGPAGFSAAKEAGKLGLKVALIERDKIGGTCLNYGCIPTKALIQSAKIYALSKDSAKFGIEIPASTINLAQIHARKQTVIEQITKGMRFMIRNINYLTGEAQFLFSNQLLVGKEKISVKQVIIATGSKPMQLPNLRIDHKKIISSKDLLNFDKIPESLLIIGGGVIGCEFASLFSILGTQVTIVELMPQLLPQEDKEIARKLEINFKKKGIKVITNTDAKTLDFNNYAQVLLCIGRRPTLGNLDLEKIGVKIEKNKILVDEYMNTNIPGISAAGDCTGGKMLAHFADHQGMVAARNINQPGNSKRIEPFLIPSCIFTSPEIASIGITEQEAGSKGVDLKISKFDFLGSSMARILDQAEGFIKIISDRKTDAILGVSIIGPKATELIGTATLALQSRFKLSQLHNIIFAHPTVSESIQKAAEN